MFGKLLDKSIQAKLRPMREKLSPELYAILEPQLIRSLQDSVLKQAPITTAPKPARTIIEAKEPAYRGELEDFVEGIKRKNPPKFFLRKGVGPISPAAVAGLEAWFRFGTGITVTGSGVSQWDDASGKGHHLLQGTDASRPALQADGSILFDGVADHLRCVNFAFAPPKTIYLLVKNITLVEGDRLFCGNTSNEALVTQQATDKLLSFNGVYIESVSLALDTYAVLCVIWDGVNSVFRINNSSVTGDGGANTGGGFVLGADGGDGVTATAFGNIQVKEAILYSGAHDAATQDKLMLYLRSIPGAK
jgi:hypothetical protein